ncbi:superoxide dismutase [Fe] 2, chloroplastic isoform X2 [Arabidopsis lyrata subsp. lyrata]|uniref:superoxide dismutase [Fe] 2, chloroplastic isoform X2 n=1 Tax=Arabidopsis lyrata subsp. lyrata TaxID=81972 RepID=UPI000A29E5A4|nr:superoxide dismutase [Fe] 2, chloroplastic isoform X2 [Arabidopsis lyrata subsp. lyrata]|eukprot:XP_020865907.1 superoxide dismutase [Fe] 2, chloroplastic isoform X2 [Arabidopsis lyrata subsp. lyrata]
MMSVAVTAISSSLSYSPLLLPSQGPKRRMQWKRNDKFSRKVAVSGVITAGFELKPPPYPLDALEPHMSRETLDYHWGKHHRTYVENLNKQIVGTDLDTLPLEEVVLLSYNRGNMLPAFNNAAQAWNHEFFWESIQPGGGGKPTGELPRLIERDFGSFEEFLERFKSAAASNFGSGWTWLAYKANRLDVANAVNPLPKEEDKKLVIVKTPNAVNPLVWDYSPLLTIDTWEHAYYLDFENRRAEYINTFMERLVSWETVSTRLESAMARAVQREQEGTETEDEENPDDEEPEVYLDSDIDVSEVD